MECGKQCRFCDIFNGKYTYEEIDKPIFETEKFALITTIGALIEGWVLIVPKKHCYSMKEFYGDEDFNNFLNRTIGLLEGTYSKKIIAFEHGANDFNSLTSCGTNHAHLHLLPFDISLVDRIIENYNWNKIRFNEKLPISNNAEYLIYSEFLGTSEKNDTYLHVLEKPISQYFRRLIAEQINRPNEYDYKEYLMLDNTVKTYEQLSAEVSKYE